MSGITSIDLERADDNRRQRIENPYPLDRDSYQPPFAARLLQQPNVELSIDARITFA